MKKIFALILLLSFCAGNICLAEDNEIKDYNRYYGNRYTDNSDVTDVANSNVNFKKIDYNDKKLKKYEKKITKYLFTQYHDNQVFLDNAQTNPGKEIYRANLKDGDYVVLYENQDKVYYGVEYHQNGEIIGIVRLSVFDRNIFLFTEYRVNNNQELERMHRLFHVINDSEIAQFIYGYDNKLKCYSINQDVYLADDISNVLVDAPDKDFLYSKHEMHQQNAPIQSESIYTTGESVAMYTGVGAMVVAAATGLVISAPIMLLSGVFALPVTVYMYKKQDKSSPNYEKSYIKFLKEM